MRAGHGRKTGQHETACTRHTRAEGKRRMRDIKFFNDLLVLCEANYQKSEPKNIDYLLFPLELNFTVSHGSHRRHFSPFNVYKWHSN